MGSRCPHQCAGSLPFLPPSYAQRACPGKHAKEGIEQGLSRILSCNADLGGQDSRATLRAIWGYLPGPHPTLSKPKAGQSR